MLRIPSIRAATSVWFQNFQAIRTLKSGNVLEKKQMPSRPPLVHESEFTEVFLKGSGPGGQKINKTSSAVQLKHIPTGLVLKVQSTRSREQNRKIAREMLAARVEEMEKGAQSRTAIVTETKVKRKSSSVKKSRRKYKALEAAKVVPDETASGKKDNKNGNDKGTTSFDNEDRGGLQP